MHGPCRKRSITRQNSTSTRGRLNFDKGRFPAFFSCLVSKKRRREKFSTVALWIRILFSLRMLIPCRRSISTSSCLGFLENYENSDYTAERL